jgi:hypothetical protein
MIIYAVLCHPGHNRVYFGQSMNFVAGELAVVSHCLSAEAVNIRAGRIAGIQYLLFETEKALTAGDLKLLGRLSFMFALFRYDGGVLIPVELPPFEYIDRNISTILKYTGKTNETFTRLLTNLAYFSLDGALRGGTVPGGTVRLLDPVAGKGTTLFEGLVCDMNVYGIEVGEKVVGEAAAFLRKYLEGAKYKHQARVEKISGKNKSFTAQRYHFEISPTKDAQKNNDIREFEIIAGNSLYADQFYRKNFFQLLVGDLPYGVQHGSVTNEKQTSLTRNPKELLQQCLPAWGQVLAPGGVAALAWNTFVLGKKEMTALLQSNGFDVFCGEAYAFEHRVDQAINRDIVIARKI